MVAMSAAKCDYNCATFLYDQYADYVILSFLTSFHVKTAQNHVFY